jgi:hypothetical protein
MLCFLSKPQVDKLPHVLAASAKAFSIKCDEPAFPSAIAKLELFDRGTNRRDVCR